ncbi:mitochondrial import inner membrane translocase subunit tim9 [Blastomyces percursus]|uniref:Mitochondrial import inner membrane translocase subunit n=1 Tax=Blastomyces percursus TaxID=1658174 RepID=A0A1J9Q7U7_9EURO|nr:mitochondrial import inner membrane translocase subunit tim9 [Blastomyces percursus]
MDWYPAQFFNPSAPPSSPFALLVLNQPINQNAYTILKKHGEFHVSAVDWSHVYSNIVQRCFEDCVSDFTTKSLISREQGCVNRCFDKFMKGSERINQRFQEQNAQMMQPGQIGGK